MFYGAYASHLEVLRGRGGAPEPTVIRDIDEEVRAIHNKPANFIRKNRLVTDENAKSAARVDSPPRSGCRSESHRRAL